MNYPQKVYAELTTRCNLSCQMCVKYTPGSDIEEADMSPAIFKRLLPSLSAVQSLVLNGIGESLLHPELLHFIQQARQYMGPEQEIGLQSNGLLITDEYASQMLEAGLSTICLSVDSMSKSSLLPPDQGHSFRAVEKAVGCLQKARAGYSGRFSLGLEIILSAETLEELPALVRWAMQNGVDYILTSHLIYYGKGTDESTLFSPYNSKQREILRSHLDKAGALGFDFFSELQSYQKFAGTRSHKQFSLLMNELQQQLIQHDFRCNFPDLKASQIDSDAHTLSLLKQAQRLADKAGIDLYLPELFALSERKCRFMEEDATFVAVNGDVMPCHFLWHSYGCHVSDTEILVAKRPFGNLADNSLSSIWNAEQYRNFRNEAAKYDYAPCWNCGQGPCPTLVNDHEQYANDCFGSGVPCGHCQWNLGGIRCL